MFYVSLNIFFLEKLHWSYSFLISFLGWGIFNQYKYFFLWKNFYWAYLFFSLSFLQTKHQNGTIIEIIIFCVVIPCFCMIGLYIKTMHYLYFKIILYTANVLTVLYNWISLVFNTWLSLHSANELLSSFLSSIVGLALVQVTSIQKKCLEIYHIWDAAVNICSVNLFHHQDQ